MRLNSSRNGSILSCGQTTQMAKNRLCVVAKGRGVTKRFHVFTGRLSELRYERHFNTSAKSLKKKVSPVLAFFPWLQSIFQSPALSNYFCRPTCLHQGKAGPLWCFIHRVVQSTASPCTVTGSHSSTLFRARDAPGSPHNTYIQAAGFCFVQCQPSLKGQWLG